MTVIEEIAAERRRQIEVEGWTPEHDDQHSDFSLAKAASVYAAVAAVGAADRAVMDSHGLRGTPGKLQELWPVSWDISYLKPKSRRHDLIKAAALIVAEIERLDRADAATAAKADAIAKEDFCRRFVDRMVRRAGETFADGTSIREYAEETAVTYWDDPYQRDEGPEECADADMSYWGE